MQQKEIQIVCFHVEDCHDNISSHKTTVQNAQMWRMPSAFRGVGGPKLQVVTVRAPEQIECVDK